MTLYDEIISKTAEVDARWREVGEVEAISIVYPVPVDHPRYSQVQSYVMAVSSLSSYHFLPGELVIVDSNTFRLKEYEKCKYILLDPHENLTKTLGYLNSLILTLDNQGYSRIVAIGGGIILNISSYIAEQLNLDLVLAPTTIMAMADVAIGGKVRVNDVQDGKFIKHAHKSFYEPSQIILDPVFLTTLNPEQIRIGLSEIIKHAIYQSPALADYLLSPEFDPFTDRKSLLKAILWTADLKRICLEVDPEESINGSNRILRAAHDASDKLEEESGLKMPHGEAVMRAMQKELSGELKVLLGNIYTKLGIYL